MSKASEYARAVSSPGGHRGTEQECPLCQPTPTFKTSDGSVEAWVSTDGGLRIRTEYAGTDGPASVPPAEITALTAWLIDTFGEGSTA